MRSTHEYYKDKMESILKSVFGPSNSESKPSGAETIQKLCGRITSATMLEDRRDALRAIKGMSRQYRREVGENCLDILIEAIKNDRSDAETVGYAVESLLNVISAEEGEERTDELMLGAEYASKILENPDNVDLLLNLLEEFEFQIRRPSTRLLTSLLFHKLFETQEAILRSPMGISKIMDVLSDSREVIRNDVLLLLAELTRSNSQIQKIVAFENAFERLMKIIEDEGLSDGDIVVEDCISIMQNLLRGNTSNQAFYREACQIQLLVSFFDFKISANTKWSDRKTANISAMLQFIRTLVSPTNSQQNISACQKMMQQCNLLNLLCTLMFAGGVPTQILVESINTVAEVIRGNMWNQQFFDSFETPSQPPRPGILAILMCMVNEKQPLPLRLAGLYCFQCYLYKNEAGQAKVINTLLPSSAETTVTSGQILCTGIFGTDPLSNWMTATALASALNSSLKPQLLRVQLSMQGKGQVTLLQQCSDLLVNSQTNNALSRIGLLLLLCSWLSECPAAVNQYLENPSNIPFLTEKIQHHYNTEHDKIIGGLCAILFGICLAYNDGSSPNYLPDTLRQIIARRIDQESFTQSLALISSSEAFTQASKQPQTIANSLNQVCFDYSFTVLFRQVSDVIHKALDPSTKTPIETATSTTTHAPSSLTDTGFEIQQYKDLLREQESQINIWKGKCEELEKALQEQTARSQVPINSVDLVNSSTNTESESEFQRIKDENVSLHRLQESMRQELAYKNTQLEKMREDLEHVQTDFYTNRSVDIQQLKKERDQLKAENELLLIEKNSLDQHLHYVQSQSSSESTVQVDELQQSIRKLQQENEQLRSRNETVEKEMEDLLVLLADNDTQLKQYKTLLTDNNIQIPESEEEEEDDDDEDV